MLELVFVDVWGPSPIPASNGERYYIAFIYAYSRYTLLYLLHAKSQVSSTFLDFKRFVEHQTGFKIKSLQTDNAKEFLALHKTLKTFGICHRLTCPHTHEQNGSIERKHRHVLNVGLSLLSGTSLPLQYWGETFLSSVMIINSFPTPVLNNNNLYTKIFKKKPDYNFFLKCLVVLVTLSYALTILTSLVCVLKSVYFLDIVQTTRDMFVSQPKVDGIFHDIYIQ